MHELTLRAAKDRARREGWIDWIRSDTDERAARNGCVFNADRGLRVVRFFENVLRHSKGEWAGQEFKLLDWQRDDVIMPLYGWERPDGTRRFRLAYIEIPKKNGKSTLASGLSLYHLIGDGEQGAEVYSAAADRGQASIVYNEAVAMVKRSTSLSSRLSLKPSVKRIIFEQTLSYYLVLTADAFRNEGLNISALIFDELHAQPDRTLWDALRYGGAARRQPMTIAITTAGKTREGNIAWEQHEYAEKVAAGVFEDDSFFGYIRGAADEDDWTDPETWRKANPSLGLTMSEESFADACREAQNNKGQEASFRRYRLNQWERRSERWLDLPKWDEGGVEPVDAGALLGRPCYAGLDLASTRDITACVFVFPDDDGGVTVVPRFWVPRDTAYQRKQRDRVPYDVWASAGWLTMTEGDWTDYTVIEEEIVAFSAQHPITQVAFDPREASMLAQRLINRGVTMVPFAQSCAAYNEPVKRFEQMVGEGKIRHGGNPVLRWMASNVSLDTNIAGLRIPSKKKSHEKIDGIVALVMAIGHVMVAEEARPSVYETRGPLVFK